MNTFYKKSMFAMLLFFGFSSLYSQADFFNKFPWLTEQYPNCEQEFFFEYDLGAFSYVWASDGQLFFEDGTFYCQDSETRDCRALYNLTKITSESGCPISDNQESKVFRLSGPTQVSLNETFCVDIIFPAIEDVQYIQVPIQYDSGSIRYEPELCRPGDVLTGIVCGNITPVQDNNINILWFHPNGLSSDVKTDDIIASICFTALTETNASVIEFKDTNGGFNFEIGSNSISDRIEFQNLEIEIMGDQNTVNSGLPLDSYPWMDGLTLFDCNTLTVTQYADGPFSFFFFEDNSQAQLFFEDGTFYCSNSASFNCLELYNLTPDKVENEWTCRSQDTGSDTGSGEGVSKSVSGVVTNTNGDPMSGVSVRLECSNGHFIIGKTNEEGLYSNKLIANVEDPSFTVSASFNAGNQCLNVFDIVKTRGYILGLFTSGQQLGSLPASVFAMDLSRDFDDSNLRTSFIDGVSTIDIVLMQRILLGLDDDRNLWRFYDSSSAVVEENFFQIDQTISFEANSALANFTGFQLGDVDDCQSYDRIEPFGFTFERNEFESNELQQCFDMRTPETFTDINAIELSVQSDPEIAFISSISRGTLLDADFNNFSGTDENGEVKFVWFSDDILGGVELNQEETLMTVCLQLQTNDPFTSDITIKDVGLVTTEFEYIGTQDNTTSFNFGGSDNDFAPDFLSNYPWAESILNCEEISTISEYSSGIFKFLYIQPAGTLYFQNGTFYCQDSDSQNCRDLYDLTSITNEWSCSGSGIKEDSNVNLSSRQQASELQLFPNPVNDLLTVLSEEPIHNLSIYNSAGQLVKQLSPQKKHLIKLYVNEIKNGMYILKIETDGHSFIKRIVKSSGTR